MPVPTPGEGLTIPRWDRFQQGVRAGPRTLPQRLMSTFVPSYARVVSRGWTRPGIAEPRPAGCEVWYYRIGDGVLRLYVNHAARTVVLA